MTAFRVGGSSSIDAIRIFSAAGRLLGRAPVESSKVVALAWTSSEVLVAVYASGGVDMWDVRGTRLDRRLVGL